MFICSLFPQSAMVQYRKQLPDNYEKPYTVLSSVAPRNITVGNSFPQCPQFLYATNQKPAENKLGQMNYIYSAKKYSKHKDPFYMVHEI